MKTVTLEIAKKMKELGCEQKSKFYWYNHGGKDRDIRFNGFKLSTKSKEMYRLGSSIDKTTRHNITSAYTADEVADMLPDNIKKNKQYDLIIYKNYDNSYCVGYETFNSARFSLYETEEKSLADALGKMWIYLKENNIT